MEKSGKDYMKSSIARTEWKLSKVLQAKTDSSDADVKLIENRCLKYLEAATDFDVVSVRTECQIELAFDNLLFFWSR